MSLLIVDPIHIASIIIETTFPVQENIAIIYRGICIHKRGMLKDLSVNKPLLLNEPLVVLVKASFKYGRNLEHGVPCGHAVTWNISDSRINTIIGKFGLK